MKKHLFIFILPILMLACSAPGSKEKPYTLTGEILGFESGWAHLQKREKGQFITMDSTLVEAGRFVFEGRMESPLFAYLKLEDQQGFITFFLEPGQVQLKASVDNMGEPVVTGSESNDIYISFQQLMKEFDEKLSAIYTRHLEAKNAGNEQLADEMEVYYQEMESDKKNHIIKFATDHFYSPVTAFVTLRNLYMLEFSDLEKITASLDPSISESVYAMDLNDRVEKLGNVQIGKPAPEFIMNDTLGNPVALSSLFGDYLFVDFWASWCGPCRRSNPDKVAAYTKFHSKGLNWIGVSLDTDRDRWIQAIHDDGLNWNHVSDLAGWGNEAASLYAVNSIPSNVLLDPNGIIIARNLKGKDIEKKLAEVLGPPVAAK